MALTAKQKREAREQQLRDEGAQAALAKLNLESTIRPDKVADAAGQIARPQSAGAKVIVACKLGVAYFDIQLCKIEDKFEQNMQGGRMVKEATRIGQVVRLRGTAYPRGTPPEGFPERPEMVGNAALTRGVDKEWFDEWLRQNHLNPLVMNKMIFAHESQDHVVGEARELSKFLSGLEPVNPKRDARIPRSTRSEIEDVATEEKRAGKAKASADAE